MKRKHTILLLIFCFAGWLASLDTSSSNGTKNTSKSTNDLVEAKQKRPSQGKFKQTTEIANINEIVDRRSLIGSQEFKRKQYDLFALENENNVVSKSPMEKPAPLPPPLAPALPFKYLGKKLEGGNLEIYLEMNQEIFIAKEKAVIQGIYRVDQIELSKISLTYLPLNQVQTFMIPY